MHTYRNVCFNILDTLKKTHKDSGIELVHVLYWVEIVADNIIKQHLLKPHGNVYLNIFPRVEVKVDSSYKPIKKYIVLPKQLIDLPNDRGIKYVAYESDDVKNQLRGMWDRTSPEKVWRLWISKYEKPSPATPYWYRSSNRLYLLGIENLQVGTLELGCFTGVDATTGCNLDNEVPLSPDQIKILTYEVLALGKFLLMIPKERMEDGTDSTSIQTMNPAVPNLQQPIAPGQEQEQ